MKKISFYLLAFSYVFGQTSVDTLSVTIYPEFSYPGVAIEYKFDKFGKDEIVFPVSSSIDSVLYTISGEGLEFEQILKTSNNTLNALNQDGNHTIYLFFFIVLRIVDCLFLGVSPAIYTDAELIREDIYYFFCT